MERNGNETKAKKCKPDEMERNGTGKGSGKRWKGKNGKTWKWKEIERHGKKWKEIYIYNLIYVYIDQITHGMKMETHGNGKKWKRKETVMGKKADRKEMGKKRKWKRRGKKC